MSAGKTGLKAEDRKAIGITLGNSNSSIAYLKEDNVEVIANEDGGKANPLTRRISKEDSGRKEEGGFAG
jgi:molecular chaperone DnaK (HSP70)